MSAWKKPRQGCGQGRACQLGPGLPLITLALIIGRARFSVLEQHKDLVLFWHMDASSIPEQSLKEHSLNANNFMSINSFLIAVAGT
jgi:hypothetical protein